MLIRERSEFYWVVGSSWSQLEDAIRLLGPCREGRRFAAYTDWSVGWSLSSTRGRPGVDVTITTTIPAWVPTSAAQASSLRREWDCYLEGLREHEAGHKAIAVEAAREVLAALETLSAMGVAEGLATEAHRRVEAVLGQARERERVYDVETRHGALDPRVGRAQGVVE